MTPSRGCRSSIGCSMARHGRCPYLLLLLFLFFATSAEASDSDPETPGSAVVGDEDASRPASPEEIAELEKHDAEVEKLQAQVNELKALKKKKEGAKAVADIGHLQEMLAQISSLEKTNRKAPGGVPPQELAAVEKMVSAFQNSKKKDELDMSGPIEEDELYVCALLSMRRYCGDETQTTTATTTGPVSPPGGNDTVSADEEPGACDLLNSFALGKQANGGSFSVGTAATAKNAVFRGIVVCLKSLDEDGLAEFRAQGGFDSKSDRKLSNAMAAEAEGQKTASMWTGEVFKLGFNKPRWTQLRKIVARHSNPKQPEESAGVEAAKDEL